MILVKLGGSLITEKSGKEEYRPRAAAAVARALARISEPLIVVHGGGSYGHYWSVRHGMHTKPGRTGARGVARVKNSMVELNSRVLETMHGAGLSPYCVPPSSLVSGKKLLAARAKEAGRVAKAGMVPVTYGDALWCGGGRTYILSGDRLMSMLAPAVGARLAVFATDVDGVLGPDGGLVAEMGGRRAATPPVRGDVTGGMARKIREARRMARSGTDVLIANGKRPNRLIYAARGSRLHGTLFRGR